MEEQQPQVSKTISDKYLESVYSSIERLQYAEMLMREGCQSLEHFVKDYNKDLTIVQYKNYQLFITEFDMILKRTKKLINPTAFNKMVSSLKALKSFEDKQNGFLLSRSNSVKNLTSYKLSKAFGIAVNLCSELNSQLISSLWVLLSPAARQDGTKIIS